MNDLLSIFIPTYNRKDDLNRLLNSIILENGADLNNIHIYISSNSPEDYETMRMGIAVERNISTYIIPSK